MRLVPLFSLILAFGLTGAVRAANAPDAQAIAFYDEQVLPILKENCFKCHGGEEHIKGGLRLTSYEGLMHGGDLGPAIELEGDVSKSLFLEMISYEDEDYQMPPKGKLPDEEIAILTKWVEIGTPYNPETEIHGEIVQYGVVTPESLEAWAWAPVREPELPKTGDAHPVDRFINAKLVAAEVESNDRADRAILIRRAFYDLTGLPPTPEEVDAFVADPGSEEEVWEALIEDLLSRPQYGEKWARHWLDLVRYAETNGFERDNPKPEIWRYRDYVVDALNSDLPYDQFVIQQLAGDEIENPTLQSLAATGYHRLMQWDDEPADRKQHVYDVLADNVQITTETFLASTVGCARCHDHKVDPFSQKDFYSFMAFYGGVTPYQTQGTMVAWATPEEKRAFDRERQEKMEGTRKELAKVEGKLRTWVTEAGLLNDAPKVKGLTFVQDGRAEDGALWEYTTSEPTRDWKEVGFRNKSWIKGQGGFGNPATPGAHVKTEWDSTDIWMRATFGLTELPESLTLEIHHDEEVKVYLNGALVHQSAGYLKDYEAIDLGEDAIAALQTGRNVVAVHCRNESGGQYVDLALKGNSVASTLQDAIQRGGKKLVAQIKEEAGQDLVKQRQDLQKRLESLRIQKAGTHLNAVTEYGGEPQQMHVHIRGSAHAEGDPVEPAFPTVLTGQLEPEPAAIPASYQTENSSGRRRVLAEWIASGENPLTARVMMNRVWQHHFGRGIVPSTSDFGALGEKPTHPELLDWLATEFVQEGWSLKSMHRLLMTSDAYQRSSAPSSAASQKDPINELLWRYDMRRLTAEEIRDSVLAASGELNLEIGGPPVYPPLDEAVLATSSKPGKGWPTSNEENSARRSLYVHMKRSLRMPLLFDHDQADTDSHCAVRFTTTVPTQALGMLNSTFINDQAARLAERLESEGHASMEEKVRAGLRLVTQSEPEASDVSHGMEMIRRLQEEAGLNDRTALQRFALLTLNLNEFVYLD